MTISPDAGLQRGAHGTSDALIHEAVLAASDPKPGLRWLDVGCGTGRLLRLVAERHEPASLAGVDIIDWLDDDLRDRVQLELGGAEVALGEVESADRVLLSESLEHVEAPWTVLRAAARVVKPGGRLVISVPNIASLHQRLDLLLKGHLTSYTPDNEAHLTPILPHVAVRVLRSEGFAATFDFAVPQPVPFLGGDRWPGFVRRHPKLTSLCLVVTAVDIRHRLNSPAPT